MSLSGWYPVITTDAPEPGNGNNYANISPATYAQIRAIVAEELAKALQENEQLRKQLSGEQFERDGKRYSYMLFEHKGRALPDCQLGDREVEDGDEQLREA